MDIGDFIRRRRKGLQISQVELARRLSEMGQETSDGRVSHWERKRNYPPITDPNFRDALALSLEIDVNTMMSELGYTIAHDDRSEAARRVAEIVDKLPPDKQQLALRLIEQVAQS